MSVNMNNLLRITRIFVFKATTNIKYHIQVPYFKYLPNVS